MEKTEMMKKYEAYTGETLEDAEERGKTLAFLSKYTRWLEAKAAAYDRLMSGSVEGMKEWANILGKPVALDDIGRGWWFTSIPKIINGEWDAPVKALIPDSYIGGGISDWTTSLTLPDGWEENQDAR